MRAEPLHSPRYTEVEIPHIHLLARSPSRSGTGHEGKRVLRLIAVPYEDIFTDWPMKKSLASLRSDRLLKLADVAWDLTALQEDAEFLLHNERLFAAGTTHE